MALLEIVLRGTLVYLVLFAMLRLTRRQAGQIGTSDVLLIVLIADAIQNAMASEYHSITAGFTLAFTIWFWSWFLNYLAFRFTVLRPLIIATPRTIIESGRVNHRTLRRELMTEDDLRSQLRLQGIQEITEVRSAWIEGDGQLSVQKRPD